LLVRTEMHHHMVLTMVTPPRGVLVTELDSDVTNTSDYMDRSMPLVVTTGRGITLYRNAEVSQSV